MAILLYAVTLGGGFAYDFYGIARNDDRLQNPHAWGTYWTQPYNGGIDNLYRPLTSTIFAIQSWLNGLDVNHAWRFHLISLLMHAGVSALVAEFARRLTNSRVALIAGLLYAAHPIHVEVITDIVGQAEMVCALGTFGAMVLFLHRPMTNLRAVAILFLFILAVLSKEQGMLLPLLLLLLTICLRIRKTDTTTQSPAFQDGETVLEYSSLATTIDEADHKNAMKILVLLLCWSLGGYIVIRERIAKFWWDRSFLDPAINPLVLSRGHDRLLMPLVLLGHYAKLLIFPWKLVPDYSGAAIGSVAHFNDPYLYFGALALLIWLSLFVIAIYRRAGVMLFCLLGVAVTYGLVANLLSIIGTNFAERLMYLPSAFFIILVAMALAQLRTPALIGAMVVILALASLRTFTYARRWNDRLALYEQAARDEPGAVRMYMALAYEYYERGDTTNALATATQARTIAPQYTRVWLFSAALAMKAGNLDDADRFLQRADAISPTMTSISLGQELLEKRAATRPAK